MFVLRFLAPFLALLSVPLHAEMRAHFINVGQGDATLLEFKKGAILIDAGGEFTGDTTHQDHLTGYIRDFFDRRGDLDRTINSVIITHPHIDHVRNLMSVLQRFKVNTLIDNGGNKGSGMYRVSLARHFAEENGIKYISVSDADIPNNGNEGLSSDLIDPFPGDPEIRILASFRNCGDQNNDSIVVRVQSDGFSFLFTGDAEWENDERCKPPKSEIDYLVQKYGSNGLLDVDVYQVGHHGSHNGTNKALMDAMSPHVSVISAGYHHRKGPERFHAWYYGHPRKHAVDILMQNTTGKRDVKFDDRSPNPPYSLYKVSQAPTELSVSKQVYCTCWDGDVVVHVKGSGKYAVTTSSF